MNEHCGKAHRLEILKNIVVGPKAVPYRCLHASGHAKRCEIPGLRRVREVWRDSKLKCSLPVLDRIFLAQIRVSKLLAHPANFHSVLASQELRLELLAILHLDWTRVTEA